MRRSFLILIALVFILPTVASAVPPVWMVPAGGEVWTAGSQHTIAWAGGTSTAVMLYHQLPISMAGNLVGAYFANTGYITFSIPAATPPGQYVLEMGFTGADADPGDHSYSPEFSIVAPPECLFGCSLVSASMIPSQPNLGSPPVAACGNSAAEASANAAAFIAAELENQCYEGYSIDPGSMSIDVTFIPTAICYSGYSGPYYAEATGFGCCCPDAVPAETWSFGSVKARYY